MVSKAIALRPAFHDARGRAPRLHGKTFIFHGRAAEHTYLYVIDVWLGDRFTTRLVCADEIFQPAKVIAAIEYAALSPALQDAPEKGIFNDTPHHQSI